MLQRIFIIFVFLSVSQSVYADETSDKAEFKKLYAEFNELYTNSAELDPIIEVGEKLYELAPKVYGEKSQNTAVITFNLASLYDEKGGRYQNDSESRAVELYKKYFNILDQLDTPKDENYLEQYISFIKAESNLTDLSSTIRYGNKAIKIAEEIELSPIKLANIEYTVAMININKSNFSRAKKFFERSKDNYIKAMGEESIGVGQNLFWLAKIDAGKGRTKAAAEKFLKSIEIFDKSGAKGNDLALVSHANLVQIYENNGQSDEATKHCIAASVERPTDFDRFVTPLYRANPEYPSSAARKGKEGQVLLEFTVDEEGFTKEVKVLESSSEDFAQSGLEAASKYRYAPSIREGKIVPTEGVKVNIEYKIR